MSLERNLDIILVNLNEIQDQFAHINNTSYLGN